MKNIWQKILEIFKDKKDYSESEEKEVLTDEIIQKFISNPETFILYRGEGGRQSNEGGLHFTTDKEWAKRFGSTILEGTLPKGSEIHLISQRDFDTGAVIMYKTKKIDETAVYKTLFDWYGYDAIIGSDPMNNNVLDVVVNPENLKYFKPSNSDSLLN